METFDLKFAKGCLSSDRLHIFSVSALILLAGAILGLLLDANENIPKAYDRISSIICWVYFMCWSISFYPQVIMNYQRKTYWIINAKQLSGYHWIIQFSICLGLHAMQLSIALFTWAVSYRSSIVQEQYMEQHRGNRNAVELNDVFFSLHAALRTVISFY